MVAFARNLTMLILALLPSIGVASSVDIGKAEKRVVAFLENVYAGERLKEAEWLTKQMRESPALQGFGGLGAVITSSQHMADEHGGVKAIKVIERQDLGNGAIRIRAEIEFNRPLRIDTGSAAIAKEDLIWNVRVYREQGRLKLEF